ncbi:hypothetical protein DM01DRAFT_1340700 [Hesseltinella vesiculosa]|uniref:Transcription factor domain-containing protein n=1 Tax=Hesseltinella vesiculosa TaxID=101127 RepID=A0A1X2G386_9FUNG|nr:hypothetical protein DM01DRAFT_1340700 [Hesseltinella vesiculosa]
MHQQQYQLREKTSANPLKAQKEWQLSIINGHLRLETGIVSIKDLLQFAHPSPIRSLSAFDTTCVPFQIGNQLSFIALTTKQLVKRGLYDSSSKTFSNAKNTYFTSSLSLEFPNTQLTSTLDPFGSMLSRNLRQIECVPLALTLDDPENVIVKFIEQFLKCYQTSLPLLHEPTYMQYFKKCHDNVVRDNMDPALAHGPVTLAICTFMSISCCHHLQLNLLQRRRLAEHFYEKCYTQLCDILDDSRPCKQLEALMTINFLQKFFFMTLRLQNMHRMGSIAILLVGELGKVTKELSQVERAILQRHATYASIFFACVEYISCKRMDDIHMTEVPLDILPDESEESKNCLCVYVHSLRLVLNPTFKQMVVIGCDETDMVPTPIYFLFLTFRNTLEES